MLYLVVEATQRYLYLIVIPQCSLTLLRCLVPMCRREDEVHEAQEQEEVCFTDLDTGRKYVVNVNDLHPVYSPSEKQNTEQDEPQRFSSGGSGQQRRRSLDGMWFIPMPSYPSG